MNPALREQLTEDEFIRSKPKGVRFLSPAIYGLARKLGIRRALPTGDHRIAGDPELDNLVLTYLLDERNEESQIEDLADLGREAAETALKPYGKSISMILMASCMKEVSRTEEAIAALSYKVEEKPKGKSSDAPVPSGK